MDHNTKDHEIWTSWSLTIIFFRKISMILNNLSLDHKISRVIWNGLLIWTSFWKGTMKPIHKSMHRMFFTFVIEKIQPGRIYLKTATEWMLSHLVETRWRRPLEKMELKSCLWLQLPGYSPPATMNVVSSTTSSTTTTTTTGCPPATMNVASSTTSSKPCKQVGGHYQGWSLIELKSCPWLLHLGGGGCHVSNGSCNYSHNGEWIMAEQRDRWPPCLGSQRTPPHLPPLHPPLLQLPPFSLFHLPPDTWQQRRSMCASAICLAPAA